MLAAMPARISALPRPGRSIDFPASATPKPGSTAEHRVEWRAKKIKCPLFWVDASCEGQIDQAERTCDKCEHLSLT